MPFILRPNPLEFKRRAREKATGSALSIFECAPIQGHIVCIVPKSDPRCDNSYPNIYDHGYGTPAGTGGINCSHMLVPYIKGVSHNYFEKYDPKEAVAKMKIQEKQRYLEREANHPKTFATCCERR